MLKCFEYYIKAWSNFFIECIEQEASEKLVYLSIKHLFYNKNHYNTNIT